MSVIVAFDVNNIAIPTKVVRQNVHTTIPKNNMEYEDVAVEPPFFFSLSFSPRKDTSIAYQAILSNFFEEKCTQNHPQ